jgi:hypothetical protein
VAERRSSAIDRRLRRHDGPLASVSGAACAEIEGLGATGSGALAAAENWVDEALKANAAAVAQMAIDQTAQIIGLEKRFSSADPVQHRPRRCRKILSNGIGYVGRNAGGSGVEFISVIGHEAAHVWQGLPGARSPSVEQQATRIQDSYLRQLGIPERTMGQ